MYTIMIVDDEGEVREGIKNNINWAEYNFELVGDCENGFDAMEMVDKLQPDIVLTDICMPFVDGLELTKYITDKYPQTRVIILTGYDEFEYAQNAVKYKAYDYILKPITANELRKILTKLSQELDAEKEKLEDFNRLKLLLNESLPILKERFLNRILSGNQTDNKIHEKFEQFNIKLVGNAFIAIEIDLDDNSSFDDTQPEVEDELLHFAVYNICETIISDSGNGIAFQNSNEKTVVILAGEDTLSLHDRAVKTAEEIKQTVEKHLKVTVTVGIGMCCSSIVDIHHSYKYAESAVDYRFLLGKNRVISINDIEGKKSEKPAFNKEWRRKLVVAIKTGTISEIDSITTKLVENLKESYESIEKSYYQIQNIVIHIIGALNELGFSELEVFGKEGGLLTEVYTIKTLEEIEDWLKNLCKKASGYLTGKRDDNSLIQAKKAEEYIRSNYRDPNISLNSICKHLLMSTSYFSSVFKNHTGQTFIEYLTRVRIEKAMELLKISDMKVYEISEEIGYKDPHYFSLIFKKISGNTPSEFRERYEENGHVS